MQKHGRIATLDCYDRTLFCQHDFFKMVSALKMGMGYFGK
jgi:hypothetical protein